MAMVAAATIRAVVVMAMETVVMIRMKGGVVQGWILKMH